MAGSIQMKDGRTASWQVVPDSLRRIPKLVHDGDPDKICEARLSRKDANRLGSEPAMPMVCKNCGERLVQVFV
jgi:hypothetical protein